jgi:hypothetical protein
MPGYDAEDDKSFAMRLRVGRRKNDLLVLDPKPDEFLVFLADPVNIREVANEAQKIQEQYGYRCLVVDRAMDPKLAILRTVPSVELNAAVKSIFEVLGNVRQARVMLGLQGEGPVADALNRVADALDKLGIRADKE